MVGYPLMLEAAGNFFRLSKIIFVSCITCSLSAPYAAPHSALHSLALWFENLGDTIGFVSNVGVALSTVCIV
jgi:hypothetical protein